MSICDPIKYSLEYTTLGPRVRKKNTVSKTKIRLVIVSFSVTLNENWNRSNRYLRLINTKQQHIFIIWVYGESMAYSSTLLNTSYQRPHASSIYKLHAIVAASWGCSLLQKTCWLTYLDLSRKLVARKLAQSLLLHIYRYLPAIKRGEHISKASSVRQALRASVLVKLPVSKNYISSVRTVNQTHVVNLGR